MNRDAKWKLGSVSDSEFPEMKAVIDTNEIQKVIKNHSRKLHS